jgi:hypothetical protein
MHLSRLITATAMVSGLAGCGLIDPNITKVTFDLPTQSYSVDSSTLNLPAGNTQAVPCGTGQIITDCCNPPAGLGLPMPDCSMTMLACEANTAGMDVCTAVVTVSQSQTLNLGQQVPQLQGAVGLGNLTINQISYTVLDNTLNIDLPPVTLFLAPNNVTDPNDPTAKKFGTVPSIAAMSTPMGTVMLESDAAATFSSFTKSLSTPFNLIATTTVHVPSGSPTPSGKIDMTVTGRLSASL